MRRLLPLVLLAVLLLPGAARAQEPDTTGPQPELALIERERDAIVDARRLRFSATADEAADMRLKVVLRAPGRLVLSQFVDVDVPGAGVRRVVTIRLTRTARRKLARLRKRIQLRVTGRAVDPAGNRTSVDETFRIAAR